jgi:hypothetical protein
MVDGEARPAAALEKQRHARSLPAGLCAARVPSMLRRDPRGEPRYAPSWKFVISVLDQRARPCRAVLQCAPPTPRRAGTIAAGLRIVMRPDVGDARASAAPQLTITRPVPGVLQLRLAGTWRVGESIPAPTLVADAIESERPDRIQIGAAGCFMGLRFGRTAGASVRPPPRPSSPASCS